jgi:hypothetical protein
MAECQSRTLVNSLQLKLIKISNINILTLLLVVGFCTFVGRVHAEYDSSSVIAMGDVGVIDTNADDGNQVKWAELNDEQRKVLAPLGKEWDTLRPWQREKMLDIARDYPKMDANKQKRIQKRLTVWSKMTPFERENARKRYQQFHSLSPEKKDELRKKWLEHQKLPEAEREKLRKESSGVYYDPDLD